MGQGLEYEGSWVRRQGLWGCGAVGWWGCGLWVGAYGVKELKGCGVSRDGVRGRVAGFWRLGLGDTG